MELIHYPHALRRVTFAVAVTFVVSGTVSLGKEPTPLREGLGLAGRYAEDRAITNDRAVLFADDFERDRVESAELTQQRWDRAWGGPRIVEAHGRRTLELARDHPGAVGVAKYLNPGLDRVFMRYYIRYDDAFPGAHHVGGGLLARAPGVPDANPGVRPRGENQFDVLLDHWALEHAFPAPGPLVAYVYHMDQQHQWGEHFYPSGKTQPGINGARGIFGASFMPRTDVVPRRGRWYCYELMIAGNTPGLRDGRIAFWIDGRLAADFPNLRFRTVNALKINRAQISMYESRSIGLQRVWIDNVVIATSYIGPMS